MDNVNLLHCVGFAVYSLAEPRLTTSGVFGPATATIFFPRLDETAPPFM